MKLKVLLLLLLCMIITGCTVETTTVQPSAHSKESEMPGDESMETDRIVEKQTMPEESTITPSPIEPEKDVSENPWKGKKIMIATDIHYLASQLTDKGEGFIYDVEHGDGKLVQYISELTDAFIDEVISEKPDILIISGDLSLNGERYSHYELADKLKKIEAAGIPVIIIPGNHDINSSNAAQYKGAERLPTENISPEEFKAVYSDFGYEEAISLDPNSLSYIYELDDETRFMMIDSCQYNMSDSSGGMISPETYEWIESEFQKASDDSYLMIPVAHHNMLDQSEVYIDYCTIEHSEKLIELVDQWCAPVFLSGHLHVQHYKKLYGDDGGIYEIVTGALSIPPCVYGMLYMQQDGSYHYETKEVDVSGWARKNNITDDNLLNFNIFKEPFLKKVFYNQAYEAYKNMKMAAEISDTEKENMANMYAELNCAYYAGRACDVASEIENSEEYMLWEKYGFDTMLLEYIKFIIKDAKQNYNVLNVKG